MSWVFEFEFSCPACFLMLWCYRSYAHCLFKMLTWLHACLISVLVCRMTLTDIVDLSSDDELGEVDVKPVKLEPGLVARKLQQNENNKALLAKHQKSKTPCAIRESEENRSSNALSTGHSSSSILDQGQSPVDDTGLSYTSP
ncbi:unnamed protein product [Prunus armeniaca]